jgi:transcriptional regulator with XRE-family HTH domain
MLNKIMDFEPAERRRRAIDKFLKRNGLTISGVCARIGMTPTTMYGFMSGKNNDIGYGTLERFATAAGTTVAILLNEGGGSDNDPMQAVPESVRQQLQPEDIEIIKQLPNLDPDQKPMLSRMLKALPREQKRTNKKNSNQSGGSK